MLRTALLLGLCLFAIVAPLPTASAEIDLFPPIVDSTLSFLTCEKDGGLTSCPLPHP